ncbi:unnamed protein product [Euphydryas editha]|uniref:Ig-like domain-containing protein n=1 Tax=Euphydryas editha TaxID=104508 RepID=A0AAU9UCR4_EUPED|nr:unnamed protein product [Euphydryas editha]
MLSNTMDFVPVSTVDVEAVVGRTATLPCDIEPDSNEDRVYMVLWFRHAGGKPLYRTNYVHQRNFDKKLRRHTILDTEAKAIVFVVFYLYFGHASRLAA